MAQASIPRRELIALLPRLRRFALSLARNAADADDLVQEACVKAMDNAARWDPAQGLDRWMFRILRNQWISEVRKRQVRTGTGQVDAGDSDELRTEVTGESHAAAGRITAHVSALPADLSSVLLLVTVEGYSYREAAEMLEIPIGTVMSRIHRARQLLAAAMASSGEYAQ